MKYRSESQKDVSLFILKNSSQARSKVDSILTETDVYTTYVEGIRFSTLIIDESLTELAESRLKGLIKQKITDLTAFFLSFPEEALTTPGIISFMLNRFNQLSINIVQLITSYTSLIILVSRADGVRAQKLLG